MSHALAYHSVVHALEARAGWTPASRFAAAIRHALNGHLPYQRHYQAGLSRQQLGTKEGEIERLVQEQLQLDLNPLTQATRRASSVKQVLWAFDTYNATVNLGVRTYVAPGADQPVRNNLLKRELVAVHEDLEACRLATAFSLSNVLQQVQANARAGTLRSLTRMSDIARLLGLEHSILMDVSVALESEGQLPIIQLARMLGVHLRTLERRLREDGLTANMLRQVARLLRATQALNSDRGLTEVAAEAGFSDHSHMTRAFRAACGMSPSFIRMLWNGAHFSPPSAKDAHFVTT